MGCTEGTRISAFLPNKQRVRGARQKCVHWISSVARKLFAWLRILPRSGILLCWADTPEQSHRALTAGPHWQKSQGEAWVKKGWSWSLGAHLGSPERDQGRGWLNHSFLPSFRAGQCPNTATSASAEGLTAAAFPFWGELNQNSHQQNKSDFGKSNISFQTCLRSLHQISTATKPGVAYKHCLVHLRIATSPQSS